MGSSSFGRLISTAILCLHSTASQLLCCPFEVLIVSQIPFCIYWSIMPSLLYTPGFNVALGDNVAECGKARTITAYLRWRPELKLEKEKREMVAKKGRVWKRSGKEGRKVVRGSDTLLSQGCVFMARSPGHRTQGYGFETINHPCAHTLKHTHTLL